MKTVRTVCWVILVSLCFVAHGRGEDEPLYGNVLDYLPGGYVTDGSVDYREQIQKCLDEHAYIYFPGSEDANAPLIYGATATLKVRPGSVVEFGPNARIRRLPDKIGPNFIELGRRARLIGVIVDGNKYAFWPLLKDRPREPYSFTVGHAIVLGGENVIEDCVVYNNAGIAFGAWGVSDNKLYRCRAENCGFLEAMGDRYWAGEHASGDGFIFYDGSHNNIVKDSEAYDCHRWGFVIEARASNNTFVDCRGGNIHFRCFGFIDVETDGSGNSLVRCRSNNSNITLMGPHNEMHQCVASHIDAQNASHARVVACTTTGGPILVGGTIESLESNPRPSPMVVFNRVFLSRPFDGGGIRVSCSDGTGIVANNVVYAYQRGAQQAAGIVTHNVGSERGNQVAYGQWDDQIAQFKDGYYLYAHFDRAFLEARKHEWAEKDTRAMLPALGVAGEPSLLKVIAGDFPFKADPDDRGVNEQWFDAAKRPADLSEAPVGTHRPTDHTFGPLGPEWYFVSIDLPQNLAGKKAYLVFGGVNEHGWVYVNGNLVGENHIWDKAFHVDVTDVLRAGANDVAIRVATSSHLVGVHRPITLVVE